ncbi:hypothetical protein ILUMI_07028 [Ignelater luminosus]|uniref:Peptidase S1 domain-containing protein n=1 Tax=Ignelater luminosus TaxID=2038154 RepID=A0A8K0D798_IGNLU|nr:hypothetical protein ILUMI_07028 [Ignelater luminosus]
MSYLISSDCLIEDVRAICRIDPNARIISGQEAVAGQFKHQVANKFRTSGGSAFCGASLICENWVLTAAHCAQGGLSFNLYLGSLDQSLPVELGRVILRAIEVHVHPGYNDYLNHDIALLRMEQKVRFSDRIYPIPLATHRTDANRKLTVSGWGKTSDTSAISPTLKYVELNTISNNECAGVYGSRVVINETLCCRGNPHHSTCSGDSGGPLIELVNGRWVQAGVVSFVHASGCASGNPSGYVRVENYLKWIRSTIGDTCTLLD